MAIVISGVGEWTPPYAISNDELVASYNLYADKFNAEHDSEIARGAVEAKPHSSSEFIEKASGIKSRFAYVKDGILDPDCMRPRIARRQVHERRHCANGERRPIDKDDHRSVRQMPGDARLAHHASENSNIDVNPAASSCLASEGAPHEQGA